MGGTLEFTLLIAAGSFLAGLLGSLTGLGGGVIIVPLLTLLFGVDIRYAIGASLVSVIATSSGAAAAYLKEGFSNIRVGMFLEVATTIGAICGALSGDAHTDGGDRHHFRNRAAVFRVDFHQARRRSADSTKAGTCRARAEIGRHLSNARRHGRRYHVTGVPLGFSTDVCGGRCFRGCWESGPAR